MEKVKVFYAVNNRICGVGEELQTAMDNWLIDNPFIEIIRVLQDASGRMDHHLTITIFYKELN